jgi:chromosome segregation ATPase
MADDVENHTVRLLQEMRAEMREGFVRLDGRLSAVEQRIATVEQRITDVEQRLGGLENRASTIEGALNKVIGAVTEIAKVQEKHSALLMELVESDRIAGSRLNAVEARLGRIEKQMGFTLA